MPDQPRTARTLNRLLDAVWAKREENLNPDLIYNLYSVDRRVEPLAYAPHPMKSFVTRLVDGLGQIYGEDNVRKGGQGEQVEGQVVAYAQDSPMSSTLNKEANWTDFIVLGRMGSNVAMTDRVYARLSRARYIKNSVDAALAIVGNKKIWDNMAMLKVAAPGSVGRRDHLVAYVNRQGVTPVLLALQEAATTSRVGFWPGLPPGVQSVSTGVGIAVHPSGRESFGQQVSNHVHAALINEASTSKEAFERQAKANLIKAGLCIVRPEFTATRQGGRPRPMDSRRPDPVDHQRATGTDRARRYADNKQVGTATRNGTRRR